MASIKRTFEKVAYYARNIARDMAPQSVFRRRLGDILAGANVYDPACLSSRLRYYNNLTKPLPVQDHASNVACIPRERSVYYYDLKEHARYFPGTLRFNLVFGDVTWVAERPSFVKSRPIHGDNANSMLMKLEKFRHFYFPRDPLAFRDKKPMAVWRGSGHNAKRVALLNRNSDRRLCDLGQTAGAPTGRAFKPFLSVHEQMGYKYVISIEGIDVATNLKWILASNSLCLMPAPVYETWFMEGRLEAGRHYVKVRDDFEDLEDSILYYERHPEEALDIIRNANTFTAQFLDETRERILCLLVMYKYFVLTGQLEPDHRIVNLFGPAPG